MVVLSEITVVSDRRSVMSTTSKIITPEQYAALHAPVPPPTPLEVFEFQRSRLAALDLAKVGDFDKFADRLPAGLFILVPVQPAPAREVDWSEYMGRIEYNDKRGTNYLDQSEMKDLGEVPSVPVLLSAVEDGRTRLNVRPSVSRENIAYEKRSAFLAWWGFIMVALFPHILVGRGYDMVSSSYGAGFVPCFCLHDGVPALNFVWGDGAGPEWGAPSCERVES